LKRMAEHLRGEAARGAVPFRFDDRHDYPMYASADGGPTQVPRPVLLSMRACGLEPLLADNKTRITLANLNGGPDLSQEYAGPDRQGPRLT
jgi:hypothetical protein